MSDVKNDLKDAFGEFITRRTTVTVIPATVTSVNESGEVCDVTDVEGNEIFDVRLKAIVDGSSQEFLIVPAVDSAVLIGNIGNSPNAWFVVEVSRVTKVVMQVSNTRYQLDASGILLMRNETTLKTILNDLISQIKLITVPVTTAPGTSGTPVNAAALEAIKIKVDEVLN